MTQNRRAYIRLIMTLMLALGSFAALFWAMGDAAAVAESYRPASRALGRFFSKLSGILPLSLTEFFIYFCALGAAAAIVRLIVHLVRRPLRLGRILRFVSAAMLIVACLVTAFLGLWGLNYFAPDMADELNLPVMGRSEEELEEVTLWLRDRAGEYAPLVGRDENGVTERLSFEALSARVLAAYERASADGSFFAPVGGRAKSVLWTSGMSKLGLTGMYFPLTAECNVNGAEIGAELPFTTAHEFAHRMGVAPENEANFAAYLSLRDSGDDLLCYSAYYSAFCYCLNALAKVDYPAAVSMYGDMDAGMIADILAANARYYAYEGPVREAASNVNNTYLQVMQQHSGVQSYGEVVDLILADYYQ